MSFPHLNGLDGAILIVLGFTLVRGAFRGLVRESLGVATVLGAYLLTGLLYMRVEPMLRDVMPSPGVAAGTAYVVTFVGIVLVLMLVFRLGEHGLVRAFDLGAANYAGGLVVGTLKGVLMVSVILFVLRATPAGAEWVRGSALARLFLPVADVLGERFLHALPDLPRQPVVPLGPA